MLLNFAAYIALLSPIIFIATAVVSWFQPGMNPTLVKRMSIVSSSIAVLVALFSGLAVIEHGVLQTGLLGINELGLSFRLDALSVIMFGMIALLSYVIMKFSFNYLDGDTRHGAFLGRLSACIASVQLLVMSGNLAVLWLAWVLTSISLHRLLIFYFDRPVAIVAARKKFILARLGDFLLLIAIALLYAQFGTGQLEQIFNSIALGNTGGIEVVAILIALVAILKSAQFPTHGWLIEVMETPTPVSALLHAGLLNAGPFLVIRLAFVMEASTYASYILMIIGGCTALFGSVVYLTQTSVKTALAYSSIAHMGFSLLTCGLGVFSAAMLHLVAHSFYKAHAFLSSGSIIDVLKSAKVAIKRPIVKSKHVVVGILMSVAVYIGFAMLLGIHLYKELSLLAVGLVLVMGLSRIFTMAMVGVSKQVFMKAMALVVVVAGSFFLLESGASYLLASQVPVVAYPSLGKIIVISLILVAFGAAIYLQIMAPGIPRHAYYRSLAIHVKNGFYINAHFDSLINASKIHSPEYRKVIQSQIKKLEELEYMRSERLEQQPI